MDISGAVSAPPNASTGSEYQLYFFDTSGQVSLLNGFVDVPNPLAAPVAIPWAITVHGLRPGFFYRYKLHTLYYMLARLEAIWFEITTTGTITITATPYSPSPSGPIANMGHSFTRTFNMTGGGHGIRSEVPNGLVEGEYLTCQITGASTSGAIIRGIRCFISGTSYEQA